MTSANGLDVQLLTEVDDSVRRTWSTLAAAAENPFATPEWHGAWLRTHPGTTGFVLSVRCGGQQIGVLPLVVREQRGVRVVRPPGGDLGDFSGPACRPRDARAVGAAVRGALPDVLGPRDVLLAERCVVGSGWHGAITAAEARTAVVRPWRSGSTMVEVALPRDGSAVRRGRDRREIGRLSRRLVEQHGVRLRTSSTTTLERDVLALVELRRWRWGLAAGPTEEAFLVDVTRSAARAGFLRLWLLEDDRHVVAALLGWSLSGRTFAHLMAFDGSFARSGPGTVLLARAVEAAVAAGDHTFDFLRGDEQHKRAYVTQQRTVRSYLLARPGSPAAWAVQAGDALQTGYQRLPRQWKDRVRAVPASLRRGGGPVATRPTS